MVVTREEALKLTVPKLKEELAARGLSHDGLKVGFCFALEFWRGVGRSTRYPAPGLVVNRAKNTRGARFADCVADWNVQMHQAKYS